MVKSQGIHMRFVQVPRSKMLETGCPSISIEVHLDQDLQEVKEHDAQPLRDLQHPVISALPQSNDKCKCHCVDDCKNDCVDCCQTKASKHEDNEKKLKICPDSPRPFAFRTMVHMMDEDHDCANLESKPVSFLAQVDEGSLRVRDGFSPHQARPR